MHDDEVDIILVPSTPSQGPSNVRPPTPKKEVFNGLFGGRRRGIASAKSSVVCRKKNPNFTLFYHALSFVFICYMCFHETLTVLLFVFTKF
jgi:hypothetical protein